MVLQNHSKRNKYEALSASFMFLSFVTAALLVVVQSNGLFANRATASHRPDSHRPNSSQPQATNNPSPESAPARQTPAPLQVGIAELLSSSFQPVALIRQSEIVVNLNQRQVSLYQDGRLQARYEIAIGREGWETPVGDFRVLNMQEHPAWQNPITGETVTDSAYNPLGSRWIGFWTDGTHQIGFHGTNQEELIGQAVSHGCIRMRDADIQALFTQVAIGTPVIVHP